MSEKIEVKGDFWANSIMGNIIRNTKDDFERYYPQEEADGLYASFIVELDSLMTDMGKKVLYDCIGTELEYNEYRQALQHNKEAVGLAV